MRGSDWNGDYGNFGGGGGAIRSFGDASSSINGLQKTPNGGFWSKRTGRNLYKSQDEAFIAGCLYNGSWDNLSGEFRLYEAKFFGKNTLIGSKGDPQISRLKNNAYLFNNPTAGIIYGMSWNTSPAGQGGGRDWLDKTQIGMESYGLTNSLKGQLFELAAKSDASISNLKYFKGIKAVGNILVVGGVIATGYEAYDDVFNKGNYYSAVTRASVLGIGFAATAIPFAGWAVAGGIGLADAIWGDQFYNWVELTIRK